MGPSHDIYSKEDPPFLMKSRRKRRRSVNPESASAEPTRNGARGDANARQSHRRHHHRHARGALSAGRIVWLVLTGVILVYVIFLAASVLRGPKKPPPHEAAPAKGASTNAPAAADHEQAAVDAARRVQDKIAAWKKIPDALLEARTLREQGHLEEAEGRLQRALEGAPTSLSVQIELAETLKEQGKYTGAADALLQALETDPNSLTAQYLLAGVYEAQSNYPAALSVAKWILETDPNSVEAHNTAANAYLNTGRKGLAVPHLRKVVSLERDNVVAQNKLGVAYAEMGQHVKAIQIFNEVLQRNTRDSVTYYNLAVCYAKQSMAEQAVEVLTRAGAVFGQAFVGAWLQSTDFDTIRKDPLFQALLKKAGQADRQNELSSSLKGTVGTEP